MSEVITHGGKKETYEQFVNKFKNKKTTDDCYTPENVYECVKNYAVKKYRIDPASIVRPFFPGENYQAKNYDGKVVVDNPPFSILSEIVNFYDDRGIPFFLFCNGLTSQAIRHSEKFGFVIVYANTTYQNGANVRTCFITNMQKNITLDGALSKQLNELKINKKLPKAPRPENVYTSADLLNIVPKDGSIIEIKNREKYKSKRLYGGAVKILKEDFKRRDEI